MLAKTGDLAVRARPDSATRCAYMYEDEPARSDFNSLEWLVIAVGAKDGSASLHWSPLGRALARIFGSGSPNRLASPCLETLRHTASLARRHGWHMPVGEIGMFLRAGWSEPQLELLIDSVVGLDRVEVARSVQPRTDLPDDRDVVQASTLGEDEQALAS
jgi:hypothetical protein